MNGLSFWIFDSPVCDSYVRPETLVRICDECNFGTYGGRCIICGSPGEYSPILSYFLPFAPPPPFPLSLRVVRDNVRPLSVFAHIYGFSLVSFSGISDAYYCAECTRLEKDRDGCPKIVNLGASRTDLFYERRRLGASVPMCMTSMCLTGCLPGFKKG